MLNKIISTILFIIIMLLPITSYATETEDLVSIHFLDANMYNAMVDCLGSKVSEKDDNNNTIKMTQSNIDSINTIRTGLSKKEIVDISGIENFKKLDTLFLDYNKISNIEPLSKLTNLTHLCIYGNQISNIEPLSGLTNLKDLALFNNQISDIEPLKSLANLNILYLASNKISNIEPLCNLTNLEELHMDNNPISDIEPLKSLTKLTHLDLEDNQIKNIEPLKNLNLLTTLQLSRNQISDIEPLKGLTNLKTLTLGTNQINNIDIVQNLTNLKELYIYKNQISDINPLKNLTNLTHLQAYNNKINDIDSLKNLNNLQELNMNSQNLNIESESNTVELPKIFLQAKDEKSKGYTKEDFTLENCTLSEDGTRITLLDGMTEAKIKINGGNLNKSILMIKVTSKVADSEIEQDNNKISNEDDTTAKGTLPKTGEAQLIIFAIFILLAIAIAVIVKYNKYREI